MKKILLLVTILNCALSYGQMIGIKGGLNLSTPTKDSNLDEQKSKIGFNVGAFVNVPISEKVSIQPEVLYSQYGSKEKLTTSRIKNTTTIVTNSSISVYLDYLVLPIMFQYKLIPSLYLEAGPELGIRINSKVKGKRIETYTTSGISSTYEFDNNGTLRNLNAFNFGIGIGAGYWITETLGANARFVAGFTDNVKDRNAGEKIKNNVFQISVSYKFK